MKPTLKLYELTDDFLHTLDDLCEQDLSPEIIALQLEELAGKWEHKALNVARYIRNLEVEAAAIDEAKHRMETRLKSAQNTINRLKAYLLNQLEITGLEPKAPDLKIKLQNNPPVVIIDDPSRIPTEYRHTEITTRILKAEIAQAIKSGKTVTGAHLEQGTRLVIG